MKQISTILMIMKMMKSIKNIDKDNKIIEKLIIN